MEKRFFAIVLFLFLYSGIGFAQFETADYMINGNTLPYRIMYPDNYDREETYPLLVFLHGSGERGCDNEKQLTHGRDFLINNFRTNFPAIVIIPQCPSDSYWANVERHNIENRNIFAFGLTDKPTVAMETLISLIKNWINSGKIKEEQIYAGGLSMGGMGVLELIWRMPGVFAAAFPICGGGDIDKVTGNAKNTALWIFHGEADSVVPVSFSRAMYDGMKKAGNEVKYTEYPDVNHNSWDYVFKENDLSSWLFSHKR